MVIKVLLAYLLILYILATGTYFLLTIWAYTLNIGLGLALTLLLPLPLMGLVLMMDLVTLPPIVTNSVKMYNIFKRS